MGRSSGLPGKGLDLDQIIGLAGRAIVVALVGYFLSKGGHDDRSPRPAVSVTQSVRSR